MNRRTSSLVSLWWASALAISGLAGCVRMADRPLLSCTQDGDCFSGDGCRSGFCRGEGWCETDVDCASSAMCSEGACVERGSNGRCVEEGDCGGGLDCVQRMCVCAQRAEVCNGFDDDCDGAVDEDFGVGRACQLPGECGAGAFQCSTDTQVECVPHGAESLAAAKTPEVCDGRDNDCNGQTDEGLGSIECGVGACSRTMDACVSGEQQVCEPGERTTEICDRVDNNCDGQVDESETLWITREGELALDACTGLTWWRSQQARTHNVDSRTACQELSIGGYSDWRMPTASEWRALVTGCDGDQCDACRDSPRCAELWDLKGVNATNGFESWCQPEASKSDTLFVMGINSGDPSYFRQPGGGWGYYLVCVRQR